MDYKHILFLSLNVIKDWRVIFITVLCFMVIGIGNYVVKYRKKPPKQKKVRAAPAPAPAAETPAEEAQS